MDYRTFYQELIKQGVKKKDALPQALELAKQAKEEAEKKQAKIEKKQKAKADKKRKGPKAPINLADDTALAG